MSYRIIYGANAHGDSAWILDEQAGRIVAEVRQLEGCKPLVELANRAAATPASSPEREWIIWATNVLQQLLVDITFVSPGMREQIAGLLRKAP